MGLMYIDSIFLLLISVEPAQLSQPRIGRHRRPRGRSGERGHVPALLGRPQPQDGRLAGGPLPQERFVVGHARRRGREGERPYSPGSDGGHGTQPRYTRFDQTAPSNDEQVFLTPQRWSS